MTTRFHSLTLLGALALGLLLGGSRLMASEELVATPFQQSIKAWMSVVALLADDGDDEDEDDEDEDEDRSSERGTCPECRERHRDQHRQHGEHRGDRGHGRRPPEGGRGGPSSQREAMRAWGPRPDAMPKLDEIIARLSRIEARMGGRPEQRGPEGQPPRPPMPTAEMKEMMERRMQEGRKRMDEARQKMEQARKKFQEMEERIRKLEAEVERLKAGK